MMDGILSHLRYKKSPLWRKYENGEILTIDERNEMARETDTSTRIIKYLTDDEIKELIVKGPFTGRVRDSSRSPDYSHPLLHLYEGGYREFINEKNWACHFCGKKIERNEGYWGSKEMIWSQGAKMCHGCFLKFLMMIEDNDYLMQLFRKLIGKEYKVLASLLSE